ncbi:hypothetical protein [Arthrobacter sp. efr-133-R2A-120]|uniref:hypothetical protein n=1 Tax=Arthrobacter sp. efr-133-R2A-120 TaxID=3040277 RepID=UPI002549EF18|nr:hypothetical protein [Arthrobacter sp. efr-133-R2A-120]
MTGLMRTWSWAASMADVEERRRHAQLMVGAVLASVSYMTIDYERLERFPELELTGPRKITDPAEWADPQWLCPGFDTVDYGIELVMTDGRISSSTWDPPGDIEGIGLRAVPLLGTGVAADADVAIWDVSGQRRWRDRCAHEIMGVELNYSPWGTGSGFWCPAVNIHFKNSSVELMLGESGPECVLVPSADNIIVR